MKFFRCGTCPRWSNRRGGHPLITFINDGTKIRKSSITSEWTIPQISKARGLPFWNTCDEAEPKEYFDDGPDWNVEQYGADEDVDQSVN